MSSLNRREFIRDSAVLAALAAAGGFGKAGPAGKSEKSDAKSGDAASQLRVAVIGVNGRGKEHVRGFAGKTTASSPPFATPTPP